MRLVISGLALFAVAHVGSAQMPPSIRKPIEAARKSVDATNAQSGAVTQSPAATAPRATSAPVPQAKVAAPAGKPVAAAPKARVAAPGQDSSKVAFVREVFAYSSEGRRDPFASPIETGEIRPLLADLRVVGIIFEASGRNSVAVMRDMSTQQQYRVKLGNILGRAKVTQIRQQEVVMTIDEYGFSRQEILKLNVQQTKGKP